MCQIGNGSEMGGAYKKQEERVSGRGQSKLLNAIYTVQKMD